MSNDALGEARPFIQSRGFGGTVTPGLRPAVLVVDLARGFTETRFAIGADLDDVVAANRRLLDAARAGGVPVYFFTAAYRPDFKDAGLVPRKQPGCKVLVLGSEAVEIDPRLGPRTDEPVIVKKAPSAFFGTNLDTMLRHEGVDTLIVTGVSTSACVRTTAVDGFSHGFPVLVPRECCGDRDVRAHEANLYDIQAKIGEVVDLDQAISYLNRVPGQRRAAG